ncbi:MAG: DUF1501 domain-containing protein [Kofleriaceae bacterium]
MPRQPSRRDVLGLCGTGALGLAFLPFLRRISRAAPGPSARADRVLIINMAGGVRSSAAFNASGKISHNPYQLMSGVSTPFALGNLLDDQGDDASYRFDPPAQNQPRLHPEILDGVSLPRFRAMATSMSVLGTYARERGDHLRARIEEPTGSASGAAPGILTRIGAGYAATTTPAGAPAFHLAPAAQFGAALGSLTKYVPVSLANVHSIPSAANVLPAWRSGTGNGFATGDEMRDRLDARAIAERHSVGKQVTETLSFHRRAARDIGGRLANDDFALANAMKGEAALGDVVLGAQTPLTNAVLKAIFRKGKPPGGQFDAYADNLALAVRLLQIGSPAVTIETPSFDFHSGEAEAAPPLYGYFARTWAALWWLLQRIPAASGGSLLDRTLVVTMSDFGRDPGGAGTGYNPGLGTDHGADNACFYLAHAVMGAGITQNKLVGSVNTDTYNAMQEPKRYAPQELLITLLDALGLDHRDEQWGFPEGGAPITELWS